MALSTTFLHWGLAEYCYYCVAGIVIGVAVYNLKLPYRISSCLYPILGDKAMGWIGTVIDILCVFGLAGGVSANSFLRAEFDKQAKAKGIKLYYPELKYCTDNAAMIGSAAFYRLMRGEIAGLDLNATPSLRLV